MKGEFIIKENKIFIKTIFSEYSSNILQNFANVREISKRYVHIKVINVILLGHFRLPWHDIGSETASRLLGGSLQSLPGLYSFHQICVLETLKHKYNSITQFWRKELLYHASLVNVFISVVIVNYKDF